MIFAENGFALTTEGADTFITEDVIASGSLIWVDSVNGSDSNTGTEGSPLATLQQAISNATANNGDIILLKSGHTQTVSSTITINKAGLKIFGIGNGSSAPRFTCTAATDCISVTANNVELNNLYFPVGTTATNTARINIDAANVRVKGCTFLCGQYDQDTLTLTANALYAEINSCSFSISASGPRYGISIESASAVGLTILSCSFNGGSYNWSAAAIHSAVAHLNYYYQTITLTNDASILHSSASSKGYISAVSADDGSGVQV